MYFLGVDATPARRDATERALNTAQKLQPNSPETLLAQAYYQYWVLRDYELAKAAFGRVRFCQAAATFLVLSPQSPDDKGIGMKVLPTGSKPLPSIRATLNG